MSIQFPAKSKYAVSYIISFGREKMLVEVYNEVKTAYGDKAMNRTSVFKLCRKFKNVSYVCA